ncbi:MAG TPA: hypothetical protein VEL76_04690 [Gemmataceae bacterium]|nr:hypothetical protein [Gemmataceae bacterium]
MNKQLMDIVLPRLAKPLHYQLERFRTGELNEKQFTRKFEALLRRQHAWLAQRGISAARAALAIHAGVLVLSLPGLRAEAEEQGVPLEVVEARAVREAATDIARNYDKDPAQAAEAIAAIIARYGD